MSTAICFQSLCSQPRPCVPPKRSVKGLPRQMSHGAWSISPLGPVSGAHQPWVCRDLTQGKRWSLGNVPSKRDVSGKNSKGTGVEAAVEMHSSGLAHVGKGLFSRRHSCQVVTSGVI